MPRGRPVGTGKYDDTRHPQLARVLAQYGATDAEIAHELEVSVQSVRGWRVRFPEFAAACQAGREAVVARTERSIVERANGYSFDSEHVQVTPSGQVVRTPIVEHVPPDTNAARWVLANYAPSQWKLNPPSRAQIALGELEGAAGLLEGARQALLAIANGKLDAQDGLRIVDAIERLGQRLERRDTELRVARLEQPETKVIEHDEQDSD
jgi:hypothetical protein